MNINITLLGEMITFAILVWITMKFVCPPIAKAMAERQKKIADGLAAAKRGNKTLELAEQKIKKELKATKATCDSLIEGAHLKVAQMIEEAKEKADEDGKKLLSLTKSSIAMEMDKAKIELRDDIADLILISAQKLMETNLDTKHNYKLIEEYIKEL